MRAPANLRDSETWRAKDKWVAPDAEWLDYHYNTLRWSARDIEESVRANTGRARKWLEGCGMHVRGSAEAQQLAVGHAEPSSVPVTREGQKKRLRNLGVSENCAWCGGYESKEYGMHLHHKDHDKRNGAMSNLCWLCGHCHRLETAMWNLWKRGKVDLQCEGRTMVINFK